MSSVNMLANAKLVEKPQDFLLTVGTVFRLYSENFLVVNCGAHLGIPINLKGFARQGLPFNIGMNVKQNPDLHGALYVGKITRIDVVGV